MNPPVSASVPRTPPIRGQTHNSTNCNSGSSGSSSSNPGSANSVLNSQGKETASGRCQGAISEGTLNDVPNETLWTSPQSQKIVYGSVGGDEARKKSAAHPIMSNKLSKRIGMLKKKKSARDIDCVTGGVTESVDLVGSPYPTADPGGPRTAERVADRKPLYVSRSSSGSASFRVAQVTRQLEGLQTALQV